MRQRVRRVPGDGAQRKEGEPFYTLFEADVGGTVPVRFRCFDALPPSDAVGLLSGDDQTGLIVWEGTLRMLQWLQSRNFVNDVVERIHTTPKSSALILELGAGCGAGSVGIASSLSQCLQQTPPLGEAPRWTVMATDANHDCVELARLNLAAARSAVNLVDSCSLSAMTYMWGHGSDEFQTAMSLSTTSPAHCVIISGDVIYALEAVESLMSAVEEVMAISTAASIVWILSYIPRSLTRAANTAILEAIDEGLLRRGWGARASLYAMPSTTADANSTDWCNCSVSWNATTNGVRSLEQGFLLELALR